MKIILMVALGRVAYFVSVFLVTLFGLYAFHLSVASPFAELRPEDAAWCREHTRCMSSACCLDLFGF
jgi:hypothetical protein